jgi:hypothetical protein
MPAPRETREKSQQEEEEEGQGQAAPSGNNATQGATTPTSQSKAAPIACTSAPTPRPVATLPAIARTYQNPIIDSYYFVAMYCTRMH